MKFVQITYNLPNGANINEPCGFGIDKDVNIRKVGVQALPGTKLIFNESRGDFQVTIGSTGVFEFSFEDIMPIYSVYIDTNSLTAISNSHTCVIMDIFYDEILQEQGGNL